MQGKPVLTASQQAFRKKVVNLPMFYAPNALDLKILNDRTYSMTLELSQKGFIAFWRSCENGQTFLCDLIVHSLNHTYVLHCNMAGTLSMHQWIIGHACTQENIIPSATESLRCHPAKVGLAQTIQAGLALPLKELKLAKRS